MERTASAFRFPKIDALRLITQQLSLIKAALRKGVDADIERVVKDAKKAGLRAELLERALQRGRERNAGNLQDMVYEGSLGNGVLVMIEALTDNPRKTGPEVRSVLSKAGGSLGVSGTAAWAFRRRGLLEYAAPADGNAREALIEAAMEAGAEDIEEGEEEEEEGEEEGEGSGGGGGGGGGGGVGGNTGSESGDARVEIWTDATELVVVREALAAAGHDSPSSEQLVYTASGERVPLGADDYEAAATAVEKLEALEDVESVWHNMRPAEVEG